MKSNTAIRLTLLVVTVFSGSTFAREKISEDNTRNWRHDESMLRALSGRPDHIIPLYVPRGKELELAEACMGLFKRHSQGEVQLTPVQMINALIWIERFQFNDAAIYIEAIIDGDYDISADKRARMESAIEHVTTGDVRVSRFTTSDEMRRLMNANGLKREHARLAIAYALAHGGDRIGIDHIAGMVLDPETPDYMRARAAIFAARHRLPIASAYEYCEELLNREDVDIERRNAAAIALMRNGIPAAIEWTENALHRLPLSEHHRIRLLSGLIQNSQAHRLVDLVSILGSTSSINVAQTRIELDALIDLNAGLLGDVRRMPDAELQASLLELIETHGNRLKWDAEETGRLVLEK